MGGKCDGQRGHRKAYRASVPPEQVRETFHCRPSTCRRCGHGLSGVDPGPPIHQVAELPKFVPIIDEYQLHRLACPDCGEATCGVSPPGIPRGCFGPYLQAVLAMLAGAYRLSKRQIQQLSSDLFALSISTGMISKLERRSEAFEAPYNELAVSAHRADAANIDGTSRRQDRRRVWPWVTVVTLATVFTIAGSRAGEVAKALLESGPDRVVTSDRFGAYEWIAVFWRQMCWAHLRRDFRATIDRGGEGEPIGRRLLAMSNRLFRSWHRVRDGTPGWKAFRARTCRLRREVRGALEDGSRCSCAEAAATCFEILEVEGGLWSSARVRGIEPTNGAAERAPRIAVIWRRISEGTDSVSESRFSWSGC